MEIDFASGDGGRNAEAQILWSMKLPSRLRHLGRCLYERSYRLVLIQDWYPYRLRPIKTRLLLIYKEPADVNRLLAVQLTGFLISRHWILKHPAV
jgi:hypothetical protein